MKDSINFLGASEITVMHIFSVTFDCIIIFVRLSLVPWPFPAFERTREKRFLYKLKSWEWPGDKASSLPYAGFLTNFFLGLAVCGLFLIN